MAPLPPHPVILSAPSTPAANPGAGGGAADTPNRAGLLVEDVGADQFEFAVAIEVHGTARRLWPRERVVAAGLPGAEWLLPTPSKPKLDSDVLLPQTLAHLPVPIAPVQTGVDTANGGRLRGGLADAFG